MQIVRAADPKKALVADMDIDFCRFWIHMSKQCLNVFNVNTILKQMTGKAVAAAMTGDLFSNTGSFCTFLEILIDAVLVKIRSGP